MSVLVYDIGASNTKYAVMNEDGEILSRGKQPTLYGTKDDFYDALYEIYKKNSDGVSGLAFSSCGRMEPDGVTYMGYIQKSLVGTNLKAEMESRTGLKVTCENDGYAAALGEWWKGAAQGTKNMMGVVLGSGIGGGIVIDGKVYRGSRGNTARNFLMTGAVDFAKGEYGNMFAACFVALYYLIAMEKQIPLEEISGPKIFEWAAEGDPVVLKYLELYYHSIALTIENSNALFDFDCVVLTGGLAEQQAVYDGVVRSYAEIIEKMCRIPELDENLVSSMALFDPADLKCDIRKGTLTQDANLYGALYTYLNS